MANFHQLCCQRAGPPYKSSNLWYWRCTLWIPPLIHNTSRCQRPLVWKHGPGHDSAVGLRLSPLLEGNDHPGGEGAERLQPETSILWENGAQVKGSHGDESQGTGKHKIPLVIFILFYFFTHSFSNMSLCLQLPAFKWGDKVLNESYAACMFLEVRASLAKKFMLSWKS